MTSATRLRLVHTCDFCGRERLAVDLVKSRHTGARFCRTNVVACVNRGSKKRGLAKKKAEGVVI